MKGDQKRGALLSTIWSLIDEPSTQSEADAPAHSPRKGVVSSFPITGSQAHALIMRGISPKTVAPLGDVLGVGVRHVTAYLDIDRGTPARQEAKGQPLPRHASEGVLRLLEIEQLAHDTFEAEDATPWLNRAHPLLGGQTPLEVAGTSYGAEQVKSILVAIRYGGAV
jgi:putative toxin-antitoxin system antitoxin component (TIGR02293 family)